MSLLNIDPRMVLFLVRQQLEGLKKHPELGKGLPFPPGDLAKELDRVVEQEARQAQAKRAWRAQTRFLREAVFGLREQFRRNAGALLARLGRYSPTLIELGVKPLGENASSARREEPPAATGTGPADDPVTPKG